MEGTTEIYFFGGHADGTAILVTESVEQYDYPTAPGMRHPRKQAFARYKRSEPWSGYFARTTFVPEGYPGKPPREKINS